IEGQDAARNRLAWRTNGSGGGWRAGWSGRGSPGEEGGRRADGDARRGCGGGCLGLEWGCRPFLPAGAKIDREAVYEDVLYAADQATTRVAQRALQVAGGEELVVFNDEAG